MGNRPTPRTSSTERELIKRSKRFAEVLPSMIVRISGNTVVQLPNEIALDLIRRRRAYPVVDPSVKPALILNETDIDDELERLLGESV